MLVCKGKRQSRTCGGQAPCGWRWAFVIVAVTVWLFLQKVCLCLLGALGVSGGKKGNFIIAFCLLSLYLPPLCFSGWTLSKRHWAGVRDADPVRPLFAHRHCHRWPHRHPGAAPALGQRGLLPEPPGGEAGRGRDRALCAVHWTRLMSSVG